MWTVLSAHPRAGELPRLPAGVRSLFLTPWWKTVAALRASDGLVFGGGSLFTDVESMRACLLWWWHAFVCWTFRKPFFLAFQGIGPFRSGAGEWCARWAVAHAAFVSVRDQASARRVAAWGLNKNIVLTFDPVFSLFKAKEISTSSQKLLVIIPRKNSPASFAERATALQKNEAWEGVRILSLAPEDREEQEVCRALVHALSVPPESIVPIWSADALASLVIGAGLVFSQRYHGALAALALGIPFEVMPQGEGDKMASLSRLFPADIAALLTDGERQLKNVLFPVFGESGKIQS